MIYLDVTKQDDWWVCFSIAFANWFKDKEEVCFKINERQKDFFSRFNFSYRLNYSGISNIVGLKDFYDIKLEDLPYGLKFPKVDSNREGGVVCHPFVYNQLWGGTYPLEKYRLILELLRVENFILGPYSGEKWRSDFIVYDFDFKDIWEILSRTVLYIGSPSPISMMCRLLSIPTVVLYDEHSWLSDLSLWYPGREKGHEVFGLNISEKIVLDSCIKNLSENANRIKVRII